MTRQPCRGPCRTGATRLAEETVDGKARPDQGRDENRNARNPGGTRPSARCGRLPRPSAMTPPPASHPEPGPGRDASRPREIPRAGWFATLRRVGRQISADHVPIVAAGVAFYFFLAVFPALTAFISIYGLITEPSEAAAMVTDLAGALPGEARSLIAGMVEAFSAQSDGKLGWALLLSVLLSLWSAKKGTNALFQGLNIVYGEKETRGFVKKNLLVLGATVTMVSGGVVAIGLVAFIPATLDLLPLPGFLDHLVDFLRWPLAAVMIITFLAWLYRIAPDREPARWRWISAGSVTATVLWLAGSAAFSWYIDSFASMDKTYGTVAAVVILMLWLNLTAFSILIGGELNSELEHQTARDTTTGAPEPMGQRGAYYADRVAPVEGSAGPPADPERRDR